jgi:hypothetical protein
VEETVVHDAVGTRIIGVFTIEDTEEEERNRENGGPSQQRSG